MFPGWVIAFFHWRYPFYWNLGVGGVITVHKASLQIVNCLDFPQIGATDESIRSMSAYKRIFYFIGGFLHELSTCSASTVP